MFKCTYTVCTENGEIWKSKKGMGGGRFGLFKKAEVVFIMHFLSSYWISFSIYRIPIVRLVCNPHFVKIS